ncbi:MAG: hypothetical protein ACFCD0_02275 [Gemmataceae bacterium]
MLHMLLPCGPALLLFSDCSIRAEEAKELGKLPLWWIATLLLTYANVAYAYIGWRLTGRFYEMWLDIDPEQAAQRKEGALSLFIAICIWILRNLVEGLAESGVPVPEILLHSSFQAVLRGLSIGFALKWWLDTQKSANAFSR